jgi:hypothetical protein
VYRITPAVSAVELRGQFKASERLVQSALQWSLLHGSTEETKITDRQTESNSRVPEATKKIGTEVLKTSLCVLLFK